MTLVVDASVVVAALVDDGEVGRWADAALDHQGLAAPHLMPFEAANILRRAALRGDVSEDVARLAHADLLDLTVELVTFEALARRAWALRSSVTVYDAAYVALAEALDAPMMTLDIRLSRAAGPRCSFITP
jgi:predicted nucleic acid-binding protein